MSTYRIESCVRGTTDWSSELPEAERAAADSARLFLPHPDSTNGFSTAPDLTVLWFVINRFQDRASAAQQVEDLSKLALPYAYRAVLFEVTDEEIETTQAALQMAPGQATELADQLLVDACERALAGDQEARQVVIAAIAAAEAKDKRV